MEIDYYRVYVNLPVLQLALCSFRRPRADPLDMPWSVVNHSVSRSAETGLDMILSLTIWIIAACVREFTSLAGLKLGSDPLWYTLVSVNHSAESGAAALQRLATAGKYQMIDYFLQLSCQHWLLIGYSLNSYPRIVSLAGCIQVVIGKINN